jgi:hypothetical protein
VAGPVFSILLAAVLAAGTLSAQHRVDPQNMYERLLCIVPMSGKGTWDDPKRPLFAPAPRDVKSNDRSGIISWHFETSDDGNFALVEFVAVDKAALRRIVAPNAPGVTAFERGKVNKNDIETAFKALKKNFDLEKFAGRTL